MILLWLEIPAVFHQILAHGASPFASGCDDTTICSIRILLGLKAWISVWGLQKWWYLQMDDFYRWMIWGYPKFRNPLVGSGHHYFCNWSFSGWLKSWVVFLLFCVPFISHCFPCALTKSQFWFLPNLFFDQTHSISMFMVGQVLYCAYPLVNVYMPIEHHHFFMGNPHFFNWAIFKFANC